MPFLDSYYAPFKQEHRYWIGLLLFVRCALFLTFALNTLGSDNLNLIIITSVTAGLMGIAWLRGRVYLKLYNDILEASLILNLCIFAAATYHVFEIKGSQGRLAYTFVGILFVICWCAYLSLLSSAENTTFLDNTEIEKASCIYVGTIKKQIFTSMKILTNIPHLFCPHAVKSP